MKKEEAVIIEAYTGVCMLTGDDRKLFYKYINQLMDRTVCTHEIPALSNEIKEKAEPDFIKICNNLGKKTRKLRAMTRQEFCQEWHKRHLYCKSNVGYCCPLQPDFKCLKQNNMKKPCKVNGKYIFIEVK